MNPMKNEKRKQSCSPRTSLPVRVGILLQRLLCTARGVPTNQQTAQEIFLLHSLSPAGVDSEEDDNEPIHSDCHSTMHTNETATARLDTKDTALFFGLDSSSDNDEEGRPRLGYLSFYDRMLQKVVSRQRLDHNVMMPQEN